MARHGARAAVIAATISAACAGARPGGDWCPRFEHPVVVGLIADERLTEASGLYESRKNPGVLWSHNDSGDGARAFAFDASGRPRAELRLEGIGAVDFEDIGGDGEFLYIADTGDNRGSRTSVAIYRVEEPHLGSAYAARLARQEDIEVIKLRYPDSPRDCETLLVDPLDRESPIYLVSKAWTGDTRVYWAKGPYANGAEVVLSEVARLDLGLHFIAARLVTAGSVSADGQEIILRTYTHAFAYRRDPTKPLYSAFSVPFCRFLLDPEPQGEGLAVDPDGRGFFTVSEGRRSEIRRYVRRSESRR